MAGLRKPTQHGVGENYEWMHIERSNFVEVLRASPLFAALSDLEMKALSERTGSRSYSSGELLFSEGEPCAGLYMIVSGRVRIFKVSASGREQVLAIEGPGNSIAELPVFDGGTYPASASAVETSELLFVSRLQPSGVKPCHRVLRVDRERVSVPATDGSGRNTPG